MDVTSVLSSDQIFVGDAKRRVMPASARLDELFEPETWFGARGYEDLQLVS